MSVDQSKSGTGTAFLPEDMLIVFASHALTVTETRYAQIREVADDYHLRMPSMTMLVR